MIIGVTVHPFHSNKTGHNQTVHKFSNICFFAFDVVKLTLFINENEGKLFQFHVEVDIMMAEDITFNLV